MILAIRKNFRTSSRQDAFVFTLLLLSAVVSRLQCLLGGSSRVHLPHAGTHRLKEAPEIRRGFRWGMWLLTLLWRSVLCGLPQGTLSQSFAFFFNLQSFAIVWQCSCTNRGQTCLESGQRTKGVLSSGQPSNLCSSNVETDFPLPCVLWTPSPSSTSHLWRSWAETGPRMFTIAPCCLEVRITPAQSTHRAVSFRESFSFRQSWKQTKQGQWICVAFWGLWIDILSVSR